MLVIISDLHFVDGTAGDHNVSAEAFLLWMDDILTLAEEKDVQRLDLLFLGDIFDLLRTEAWLKVDLPHRPWGNRDINENPTALTDECRATAMEILNAIGEQTKEHLAVLTGRHPRVKQRIAKWEEKSGTKIRRFFIAGNHDRLYCVDPAIRQRVRELLDVHEGTVPGLSDHVYRSAEYGLIARHGHELDVWNFEGYEKEQRAFSFAPEAYQMVPIGDPITTELVVRLPMLVKRLLVGQVRNAVAEGVYKRLQNIENVRPVTAAIPWIWYEAGAIGASPRAPGTDDRWQGDEREMVIETVSIAAAKVARDFMELPIVARWIDDRDKRGWDQADSLQALSTLLRLGVGIRELSTLMKTLDGFERFARSDIDRHRAAAFFEPELESSDFHYVVYGHTHQFEHAALKVVDGHEKIYVNSGTWRPRFFLADNKKDFVQWKEMTFLVFFTPDEDKKGYANKGHSMLTWTGTMLKGPRQQA